MALWLSATPGYAKHCNTVIEGVLILFPQGLRVGVKYRVIGSIARNFVLSAYIAHNFSA